MKKLIDIHTHFLSKDYLDFLEKHNALLEDGFPMPSYDIKEHVELMKECKIEYSILSVSSPQPYFEGYDKESIEMCSLVNYSRPTLMLRGRSFLFHLPLRVDVHLGCTPTCLTRYPQALGSDSSCPTFIFVI